MPAILFIIPSLIGTEDPFWWDEVIYYLGEEKGPTKVQELKRIPNERRLKYLDELRAACIKPPLRQMQLNVDQLRDMQENNITIANHSYTHPMFDQCTEQELRSELRLSKDFFDKNGLRSYHIFAYPNGNYNQQAKRILREEGIKYAFLFDHRINKTPHDTLLLSRLSVNDDTPIWKFKLILSGWHSYLLPLIKGIYRIVR